jgi:hypothetical protein
MFMGGADGNLITSPQAAYAVRAVRMRRIHEPASNKHKHLPARGATFLHAGKPDLRGQADK